MKIFRYYPGYSMLLLFCILTNCFSPTKGIWQKNPLYEPLTTARTWDPIAKTTTLPPSETSSQQPARSRQYELEKIYAPNPQEVHRKLYHELYKAILNSDNDTLASCITQLKTFNQDVLDTLPDLTLSHKPISYFTLLQAAVIAGLADIVGQLLRLGGHVNIPDRHGNTALHYAAARGNEDIVQMLLRENAIAWPTNHQGETPLHKAAQQGHTNICALFLDHPFLTIDRNQTDTGGNTARDLAILDTYHQTADYLRTKGVRSRKQSAARQPTKTYYAVGNLYYPSNTIFASLRTGKPTYCWVFRGYCQEKISCF